MAVIQGRAYWSFVTTPNTKFTPAYTVNLVVDRKVADDFKSRGYTVKEMEEGPALIIKRKVEGPNGMVRQPPRLLDKNKREIDVNVGNGSLVNVQFKEWDTVWKGQTFKGLDFQAMQVIDLVEYGQPDGAEFDVADNDYEEEL